MTEEEKKTLEKEETKKLPIPNDGECIEITLPDGQVSKVCTVKWCPIKPTDKPAGDKQPDKK